MNGRPWPLNGHLGRFPPIRFMYENQPMIDTALVPNHIYLRHALTSPSCKWISSVSIRPLTRSNRRGRIAVLRPSGEAKCRPKHNRSRDCRVTSSVRPISPSLPFSAFTHSDTIGARKNREHDMRANFVRRLRPAQITNMHPNESGVRIKCFQDCHNPNIYLHVGPRHFLCDWQIKNGKQLIMY